MPLPNDIARCPGVGSDEEGWREGCDDCRRRTERGTGEAVPYMVPPIIIVFMCEYYREPLPEGK